MKTIGLIGGMSWESTLSYYKAINEEVKERCGGLHSAKICLYSLDFAEIAALQQQGDWDKMTEILSQAAQSVEAGGADCILICTNTMHKVAPQVAQSVSLPLLHIADATVEKLIADGIKKVALLGTKFTMQQDFYKGRLMDKYKLDVIIPTPEQQETIHNVIFSELCLRQINEPSKQNYLNIINDLYEKGAEAIILGCTEIALLVNQKYTQVPLYDTTEIHAKAAVEFALKN